MLGFAGVPCIARFPNKTYIMPYWVEVDQTATLEDALRYVHVDTQVVHKPIMETFKVEGRPYVITVMDTNISCSCPGFQFRRKCKHVEAYKNEKR